MVRNFNILFLLITSFYFSQVHDPLVVKIIKNQSLMKSDMEKGFQELLKLEKKAIKENNNKAKLEILNNKAFYYFTQAEYDKAYQLAKKLEALAIEDGDKRLQALAMNRLGITLSFLELYTESEKKLLEAKDFIENNDIHDKHLLKASNYQFLSDLYSHTNKNDKSIFFIKKTLPEYEKINDPSERKKQIIRGNGNIGLKYLYVNLDSAAHYFEKSLNLQDKIEVKNYNVSNYVGLGEVYNRKGNYNKSIEYLKKAEEINSKVKDEYYMTSIYELLQDSYKKVGNNTLHYKYKLLYLENLQEENEEKLSGVNTLVNEVRKESQNVILENQKKTYISFAFAVIAVLLIVILIYFINRYKSKKIEKELIHKELVVKEKQLENLEGKVADVLHEVIELAKENNSNFYPRFLDLYPDFEQKLLAIEPKLSKSELEFCALLKLNFSSKEIANYTFISIRTVQNKKYRIRNKLKILNETDTYVFFNNL